MAPRLLLLVVSFLALSTVGWGEGRDPASFHGKAPQITQHSLQTPQTGGDSKHLHELFMNVVSGARQWLAPGKETQVQINFAENKPAPVAATLDDVGTHSLPVGRSLASIPLGTPRIAIPWATGPGLPLK